VPYVSVRITRDDVTAGQMRLVVEEITRTLVNLPGNTLVLFDAGGYTVLD
jgi:phenylpyruvate tautomerase PptA (4-oxalocrotonate tautomerase family)